MQTCRQTGSKSAGVTKAVKPRLTRRSPKPERHAGQSGVLTLTATGVTAQPDEVVADDSDL
ncbi:hypothetical protein KCP69_09295 [Salmonella enterica subsp. enterica]|nr:hypothetical protein KCP69_09295 [Salmonella enterica subsp. enterica]